MDAKKLCPVFTAERLVRRHGELPVKVGLATPPNIPARTSIPELLEPREVLERKTGSKAGRNARLQGVPIFN